MKINKAICLYGTRSLKEGFIEKLEAKLRTKVDREQTISVRDNMGVNFGRDFTGFDGLKDIAVRIDYGYGKNIPDIARLYGDIKKLNIEKTIKEIDEKATICDPSNTSFGAIYFIQPSMTPFSGLMQGMFSEDDDNIDMQKNEIHIQGFGDIGRDEVTKIKEQLERFNIEITNYENEKDGRTYTQKHAVGYSYGMSYPRIDMYVKWKNSDLSQSSIKIFSEIQKVILPIHLATIYSESFREDMQNTISKDRGSPFSGAFSYSSLVDFNLSAHLSTRIPFQYKGRSMHADFVLRDRNRIDLKNHLSCKS